MAEVKARREIIIKAQLENTGAVSKFARHFGDVSKNIGTATSSLKNFQSLLGLGLAGFSVREITRILDTFSLLRDRITAFYGSASNANQIMDSLSDQARKMNTSIEFMVDGFNKASIALSDLGVNAEGTQAFMGVLNQTFRLSGASIQASQGALVQLTEGLASGTLRGRELRSVVEQNAVFARILAKEVGITTGELITYGQKVGGIRADAVFKAMVKNFDEVQKGAKSLSPTFEQTFTVLKDQAGLAIFRLVDSFDVMRNFNKLSMEMLDATIELSAVLYIFANSTLEMVINGWKNLADWGGVLIDLVKYMTNSFGTFIDEFSNDWGNMWSDWADNMKLLVTNTSLLPSFLNILGERFSWLGGIIAAVFTGIADPQNAWSNIQKAMADTSGIDAAIDALAEGVEFSMALENAQERLAASEEKLQKKQLERALKTLAGRRGILELKDAYKITSEELAALNAKYDSGIISLEKYRNTLEQMKLDELKGAYTAGADSLDDYTKKVEKLKEEFEQLRNPVISMSDEVKRLNQQLDFGVISMDEYDGALQNLALRELADQWHNGTINADEYHKKLKEISRDSRSVLGGVGEGIQAYADSMKDLAANVSTFVQSTFKGLEDSLVSFVTTGKFEFRKFADSVIADLTRIIIRQAVLAPIVGAMFPTTSPSAGATSAGYNTSTSLGSGVQAAHGKVFQNGDVTAFASGGVVSSPTFFPMRRGTGLMGEKGPEAIVPLKRTASGDLGVRATPSNVVVNVNNQYASEVDAKVNESEGPDGMRILDILIERKAAEGIASGRMDRIFGQRFGLRARGV